jgi:hypothetical protein
MNTAKVSLVCIAKNEDHYIEEWIKYNFKLGFDHIYVYQNNWRYFQKNNLSNVSWLEIYGEAKQLHAYNHYIKYYSHNYQWTAFFDVDEFLVLNKHSNIKNFLNDYENYKTIGINWAIFGHNNHESVSDNDHKVLSRFTKRSTEKFDKNKHVKIISQSPLSMMVNPHYNSDPYWFNLNKQPRIGPYNEPVDWSVAQLNHYCTKSIEEMHIKINRGRADILEKRSLEDLLIEGNANHIEDLKALEFFTN